MPASRPSIPPRAAPPLDSGSAVRRTSIDDIPTMPYGIDLSHLRPEMDPEADAMTGFFVTAEAAPLLPIAVEESRVQPKSSLAPTAMSVRPDALSEVGLGSASGGENAPWSFELLWRRRFFLLGAAATAFVLSATAARLTGARRSPRDAARVAPPAQMAAAAPIPGPVSVGIPPVVEPAPAPAEDALVAAQTKTKRRAHTWHPKPAVSVKRPFTPSEI